MPLTNVFAAALLALLLTQPLQTEGPAQPVEILTPDAPAYGEVLAALQPSVEELLGIPVGMNVRQLKVQGDFSFVSAEVINPDGRAIDFSQTRIADMAASNFDGPSLWAYLKRTDGAWQVLEQDIGPTDAWFAFWPSKHGGSCDIIHIGSEC